jgi:Na+-translocating ferredoxin:NAD+ oxidoreductase RNF subunit RnfB
MDPGAILGSAAILGGVGLTFATVIAVCHRKLKVWEDPRIDAVTGLLPGANCGACGSAGCRNFAERLVGGKAQPAACTVMNDDGRMAVASYLGVGVGDAVKRVARLMCAGGSDVARQQAEYRGHPSCAAAAAVSTGGKGCAWGCMGLADCARSCDFDAIRMGPTGLPVVDPAKCTACGDCVVACPKDLFVVLPVTRRLLVQCRSAMEGDAAEALCRAACTACGRCVQDAKPGLIQIANGLAVVDPSRPDLESPDATKRCPTGAIVWCEGAQFASPRTVPAAAKELVTS